MRLSRRALPLVVGAALGATLVATPTGARAAVPTFLHVTTTADGVDTHPGDGICRTAGGACSLRAAAQEANALSGAQTIVLPAGRFELTRPTKWPLPSQTVDLETNPANGDLDLFGATTVTGAGARRTVIDANGLDRAFNVLPTAALSLADLTITGGDATTNDHTPFDIALGGAVLNTGRFSMTRVRLVGNRADGGGGVFSTPFTTITVRNSLIASNTAVEGGGLRLDGGGTIVDTTITRNKLFFRDFSRYIPDEITGYGGGVDHRGSGNVTIIGSRITDNVALKAGGGYNSGQDYVPVAALTTLWPYRTYLRDTTITGNTVRSLPADCHVSSMVIVSRGGNTDGDGSCSLTAATDHAGS